MTEVTAKPIEVNVVQIHLVVEEKRTRFTKAMLKSLPIYVSARWDAAVKKEPLPTPICKVLRTLVEPNHRGHDWLFLCKDPVAGLALFVPFLPAGVLAKRDDGIKADDLSAVPTAIF